MIALSWLSTTLIVFGIVLNNNKDYRGFYLWIIANLLRFAIHYKADLPALAVADILFFLLAIRGLQNWNKKIK